MQAIGAIKEIMVLFMVVIEEAEVAVTEVDMVGELQVKILHTNITAYQHQLKL